jgi:hypothetical protein
MEGEKKLKKIRKEPKEPKATKEPKAQLDTDVVKEPVVSVEEPVQVEPVESNGVLKNGVDPIEIENPVVASDEKLDSGLIVPQTVLIEEPQEEVKELLINGVDPLAFQKLEEKAAKAQEAFEKEEKLRKECEALNSKLLAEKTALLDSLSGEKGALQDFQEKTAKLTAQKNDLDNQLRVSIQTFLYIVKNMKSIIFSKLF